MVLSIICFIQQLSLILLYSDATCLKPEQNDALVLVSLFMTNSSWPLLPRYLLVFPFEYVVCCGKQPNIFGERDASTVQWVSCFASLYFFYPNTCDVLERSSLLCLPDEHCTVLRSPSTALVVQPLGLSRWSYGYSAEALFSNFLAIGSTLDLVSNTYRS